MATKTAPQTSPTPAWVTGPGRYKPRLLRKNAPPISTLCRGAGRLASTAKYQKNICSKSGMLRMISIYTSAILATSQLLDRRATPTTNPMMVAATTPMADTSRVLAVSYTHLRAHETDSYLVCRLLLEK